jgi:hypothetical protein
MSGLLRGMASPLLLWWALVCPVFAQSDPLSFGPPVIPPPDPPADERCEQHSVEISGIRCFSLSLHRPISVTEQCARWAKEMNIDPLFCSRPPSNTFHPSASTEPPHGGLPAPTPAPNSNPYPPPPVDLTALANLSNLVAKNKPAPEKTTSASAPSSASAPATSAPAPTLPLYSDGLDAARIARLARRAPATDSHLESPMKELMALYERNQRDLENMRREGAKKDKQEDAKWAMSTAGYLWTARNLATEETILTLLQSATNNSAFATKLAPQVFKLVKMRPSGIGLLLTFGAGATYYLYEYFGFDESVKPVAIIRDGTVSALPRP